MSPARPFQAGHSQVRRWAMWLARWSAGFALITLLVVLALRWVPPPFSSMMLQRQAKALFRKDAPPLRYQWAPLEEMSPQAALAVIAAEDQLFLEHWGFDLESIGRAVRHNSRSQRVRGASTITQQVAKNLFLWPGRNWLRKGLEAGLTLLIEACWSKRRILEVYLNIAQFGDGVYGIPAASRHLLGTDPRRLSGAQAARLAAVLPNPRQFSVRRPSPYVWRRIGWIQGQMQQMGSTDLLRQLER